MPEHRAWLQICIGRGRRARQQPPDEPIMAGYSPATSEEQEGLPPPPPGADSSSSSSSNPDPRVEAEIALQEREADLSMEDLVQQQYEEPNEQELDEEVRKSRKLFMAK
eukprot:scaffold814_cov15-Tisochrysis_lutea.AAC.1